MAAPVGASGQSVEVDVDRAIRIDKDLAPTPGRCTEGETAMDMPRTRKNATLENDVLVCLAFCHSLGCKSMYRTHFRIITNVDEGLLGSPRFLKLLVEVIIRL